MNVTDGEKEKKNSTAVDRYAHFMKLSGNT